MKNRLSIENFSTISTNDCCCDSLAEYKDIYKVFINLFDKYPGNEEIIVRLAYTLGNVVAKIDNTRVKVNSFILRLWTCNDSLFSVL
jgi:hypothetical protein